MYNYNLVEKPKYESEHGKKIKKYTAAELNWTVPMEYVVIGNMQRKESFSGQWEKSVKEGKVKIVFTNKLVANAGTDSP